MEAPLRNREWPSSGQKLTILHTILHTVLHNVDMHIREERGPCLPLFASFLVWQA